MLNGYVSIADRLEQQIASGQWKVNDRLPGTRELAQEYGVTTLTMQRAMARLAEKGMIRRAPRQGSFVSSSPRATTVGLLLGKGIINLPSPFYIKLLHEFQRQAAEFGLNTREYIVFDESSVYRSMHDLEVDAESGLLRCVIPVYFNPKVGHWLDQHRNLAFVTTGGVDYADMAYQGMVHLLGKGYADIRCLSVIDDPGRNDHGRETARKEREGVTRALRESGLGSDATRIEYGVISDAEAYRQTKAFLAEPGEARKAILCMHDLAVRGVVMALLEAGVKVGSKVGLVSHMNAGLEIFAPFTITQLRVDPAEEVRNTLTYIRENLVGLLPGRNAPSVVSRAVLQEGESA